MKVITNEWVQKAEADYATAEREWRVRKHPNYDAVCFHCQQCLEKYLKARLSEADLYFPKTHDLVALLEAVKPVEPFWVTYLPIFQRLTNYVVEFRYPGESADKEDARDAIQHCRQLRRAIRLSMRLEV